MSLRSNVLIFLFLTVGVVIGWGLGILTASSRPSPIIIDNNAKIGLPSGEALPDAFEAAVLGNFTASINGKAYYPANCAAAKRINEENKIWFETAAEAEGEGYQPAKNCSF